MKNTERRKAIKQMAFFALGSSAIWQSCSSATEKNSVRIPRMPLDPFYLPADAFTTAEDVKELVGAKIRSEHTNGQFCCVEVSMQRKQAGPPPHLHRELDEVMRVLEGTIHVMVDDTVTELHAGDWHVRPHGLVHTFWNAGDVPAKFIDIYPNQDFVSFLEEGARILLMLQTKQIALGTPEGQKHFTKLNEKFGIEVFFDKFPAIIEKYGLKV